MHKYILIFICGIDASSFSLINCTITFPLAFVFATNIALIFCRRRALIGSNQLPKGQILSLLQYEIHSQQLNMCFGFLLRQKDNNVN